MADFVVNIKGIADLSAVEAAIKQLNGTGVQIDIGANAKGLKSLAKLGSGLTDVLNDAKAGSKSVKELQDSLSKLGIPKDAIKGMKTLDDIAQSTTKMLEAAEIKLDQGLLSGKINFNDLVDDKDFQRNINNFIGDFDWFAKIAESRLEGIGETGKKVFSQMFNETASSGKSGFEKTLKRMEAEISKFQDQTDAAFDKIGDKYLHLQPDEIRRSKAPGKSSLTTAVAEGFTEASKDRDQRRASKAVDPAADKQAKANVKAEKQEREQRSETTQKKLSQGTAQAMLEAEKWSSQIKEPVYDNLGKERKKGLERNAAKLNISARELYARQLLGIPEQGYSEDAVDIAEYAKALYKKVEQDSAYLKHDKKRYQEALSQDRFGVEAATSMQEREADKILEFMGRQDLQNQTYEEFKKKYDEKIRQRQEEDRIADENKPERRKREKRSAADLIMDNLTNEEQKKREQRSKNIASEIARATNLSKLKAGDLSVVDNKIYKLTQELSNIKNKNLEGLDLETIGNAISDAKKSLSDAANWVKESRYEEKAISDSPFVRPNGRPLFKLGATLDEFDIDNLDSIDLSLHRMIESLDSMDEKVREASNGVAAAQDVQTESNKNLTQSSGEVSDAQNTQTESNKNLTQSSQETTNAQNTQTESNKNLTQSSQETTNAQNTQTESNKNLTQSSQETTNAQNTQTKANNELTQSSGEVSDAQNTLERNTNAQSQVVKDGILRGAKDLYELIQREIFKGYNRELQLMKDKGVTADPRYSIRIDDFEKELYAAKSNLEGWLSKIEDQGNGKFISTLDSPFPYFADEIYRPLIGAGEEISKEWVDQLRQGISDFDQVYKSLEDFKNSFDVKELPSDVPDNPRYGEDAIKSYGFKAKTQKNILNSQAMARDIFEQITPEQFAFADEISKAFDFSNARKMNLSDFVKYAENAQYNLGDVLQDRLDLGSIKAFDVLQTQLKNLEKVKEDLSKINMSDADRDSLKYSLDNTEKLLRQASNIIGKNTKSEREMLSKIYDDYFASKLNQIDDVFSKKVSDLDQQDLSFIERMSQRRTMIERYGLLQNKSFRKLQVGYGRTIEGTPIQALQNLSEKGPAYLSAATRRETSNLRHAFKNTFDKFFELKNGWAFERLMPRTYAEFESDKRQTKLATILTDEKLISNLKEYLKENPDDKDIQYSLEEEKKSLNVAKNIFEERFGIPYDQAVSDAQNAQIKSNKELTDSAQESADATEKASEAENKAAEYRRKIAETADPKELVGIYSSLNKEADALKEKDLKGQAAKDASIPWGEENKTRAQDVIKTIKEELTTRASDLIGGDQSIAQQFRDAIEQSGEKQQSFKSLNQALSKFGVSNKKDKGARNIIDAEEEIADAVVPFADRLEEAGDKYNKARAELEKKVYELVNSGQEVNKETVGSLVQSVSAYRDEIAACIKEVEDLDKKSNLYGIDEDTKDKYAVTTAYGDALEEALYDRDIKASIDDYSNLPNGSGAANVANYKATIQAYTPIKIKELQDLVKAGDREGLASFAQEYKLLDQSKANRKGMAVAMERAIEKLFGTLKAADAYKAKEAIKDSPEKFLKSLAESGKIVQEEAIKSRETQEKTRERKQVLEREYEKAFEDLTKGMSKEEIEQNLVELNNKAWETARAAEEEIKRTAQGLVEKQRKIEERNNLFDNSEYYVNGPKKRIDDRMSVIQEGENWVDKAGNKYTQDQVLKYTKEELDKMVADARDEARGISEEQVKQASDAIQEERRSERVATEKEGNLIGKQDVGTEVKTDDIYNSMQDAAQNLEQASIDETRAIQRQEKATQNKTKTTNKETKATQEKTKAIEKETKAIEEKTEATQTQTKTEKTDAVNAGKKAAATVTTIFDEIEGSVLNNIKSKQGKTLSTMLEQYMDRKGREKTGMKNNIEDSILRYFNEKSVNDSEAQQMYKSLVDIADRKGAAEGSAEAALKNIVGDMINGNTKLEPGLMQGFENMRSAYGAANGQETGVTKKQLQEANRQWNTAIENAKKTAQTVEQYSDMLSQSYDSIINGNEDLAKKMGSKEFVIGRSINALLGEETGKLLTRKGLNGNEIDVTNAAQYVQTYIDLLKTNGEPGVNKHFADTRVTSAEKRLRKLSDEYAKSVASLPKSSSTTTEETKGTEGVTAGEQAIVDAVGQGANLVARSQEQTANEPTSDQTTQTGTGEEGTKTGGKKNKPSRGAMQGASEFVMLPQTIGFIRKWARILGGEDEKKYGNIKKDGKITKEEYDDLKKRATDKTNQEKEYKYEQQRQKLRNAGDEAARHDAAVAQARKDRIDSTDFQARIEDAMQYGVENGLISEYDKMVDKEDLKAAYLLMKEDEFYEASKTPTPNAYNLPNERAIAKQEEAAIPGAIQLQNERFAAYQAELARQQVEKKRINDILEENANEIRKTLAYRRDLEKQWSDYAKEFTTGQQEDLDRRKQEGRERAEAGYDDELVKKRRELEIAAQKAAENQKRIAERQQEIDDSEQQLAKAERNKVEAENKYNQANLKAKEAKLKAQQTGTEQDKKNAKIANEAANVAKAELEVAKQKVKTAKDDVGTAKDKMSRINGAAIAEQQGKIAQLEKEVFEAEKDYAEKRSEYNRLELDAQEAKVKAQKQGLEADSQAAKYRKEIADKAKEERDLAKKRLGAKKGALEKEENIVKLYEQGYDAATAEYLDLKSEFENQRRNARLSKRDSGKPTEEKPRENLAYSDLYNWQDSKKSKINQAVLALSNTPFEGLTSSKVTNIGFGIIDNLEEVMKQAEDATDKAELKARVAAEDIKDAEARMNAASERIAEKKTAMSIAADDYEKFYIEQAFGSDEELQKQYLDAKQEYINRQNDHTKAVEEATKAQHQETLATKRLEAAKKVQQQMTVQAEVEDRYNKALASDFKGLQKEEIESLKQEVKQSREDLVRAVVSAGEEGYSYAQKVTGSNVNQVAWGTADYARSTAILRDNISNTYGDNELAFTSRNYEKDASGQAVRDKYGNKVRRQYYSRFRGKGGEAGEEISESIWQYSKQAFISMYDQIKAVDDEIRLMRKLAPTWDTGNLTEYVDELGDLGVAYGKTKAEMADASMLMMRSGYGGAAESLQKLNKQLTVQQVLLSNVADEEMSVGDAGDFLVAGMKAYSNDIAEIQKTYGVGENSAMAKFADHMVDQLNLVSNNFAVTSNMLTTALPKSMAIMANAGMDWDQSIGLITGGSEILQNANTVSNSMKMIGNRYTQMADADSKTGQWLEDFYVNKVGINPWKTDDQGRKTLRNMYEVFGELFTKDETTDASIWDSLQTTEQQQFLLKAAGSNRSNVMAAIAGNWGNVEKATAMSQLSLGSAEASNEVMMDSIEGRISKAKAAWQNFVTDNEGGGYLKSAITGGIDIGTQALKGINGLSKTGQLGLEAGLGVIGLGSLWGSMSDQSFIGAIGDFNQLINDSVLGAVEGKQKFNKKVSGRTAEKMMGNLSKFFDVTDPTQIAQMADAKEALTNAARTQKTTAEFQDKAKGVFQSVIDNADELANGTKNVSFTMGEVDDALKKAKKGSRFDVIGEYAEKAGQKVESVLASPMGILGLVAGGIVTYKDLFDSRQEKIDYAKSGQRTKDKYDASVQTMEEISTFVENLSAYSSLGWEGLDASSFNENLKKLQDESTKLQKKWLDEAYGSGRAMISMGEEMNRKEYSSDSLIGKIYQKSGQAYGSRMDADTGGMGIDTDTRRTSADKINAGVATVEKSKQSFIEAYNSGDAAKAQSTWETYQKQRDSLGSSYIDELQQIADVYSADFERKQRNGEIAANEKNPYEFANNNNAYNDLLEALENDGRTEIADSIRQQTKALDLVGNNSEETAKAVKHAMQLGTAEVETVIQEQAEAAQTVGGASQALQGSVTTTEANESYVKDLLDASKNGGLVDQQTVDELTAAYGESVANSIIEQANNGEFANAAEVQKALDIGASERMALSYGSVEEMLANENSLDDIARQVQATRGLTDAQARAEAAKYQLTAAGEQGIGSLNGLDSAIAALVNSGNLTTLVTGLEGLNGVLNQDTMTYSEGLLGYLNLTDDQKKAVFGALEKAGYTQTQQEEWTAESGTYDPTAAKEKILEARDGLKNLLFGEESAEVDVPVKLKPEVDEEGTQEEFKLTYSNVAKYWENSQNTDPVEVQEKVKIGLENEFEDGNLSGYDYERAVKDYTNGMDVLEINQKYHLNLEPDNGGDVTGTIEQAMAKVNAALADEGAEFNVNTNSTHTTTFVEEGQPTHDAQYNADSFHTTHLEQEGYAPRPGAFNATSIHTIFKKVVDIAKGAEDGPATGGVIRSDGSVGQRGVGKTNWGGMFAKGGKTNNHTIWVGDEYSGHGKTKPELVVTPDGAATLAGVSGWEQMDVPAGTKIYNNRDTEKLLANSSSNKGKRYATGNAKPDFSSWASSTTLPNSELPTLNVILGTEKECLEYAEDINEKVSDTLKSYQGINSVLEDEVKYTQSIAEYFGYDMTDSLVELYELQIKNLEAEKAALEAAGATYNNSSDYRTVLQSIIEAKQTIVELSQKQLEAELEIIEAETKLLESQYAHDATKRVELLEQYDKVMGEVSSRATEIRENAKKEGRELYQSELNYISKLSEQWWDAYEKKNDYYEDTANEYKKELDTQIDSLSSAIKWMTSEYSDYISNVKDAGSIQKEMISEQIELLQKENKEITRKNTLMQAEQDLLEVSNKKYAVYRDGELQYLADAEDVQKSQKKLDDIVDSQAREKRIEDLQQQSKDVAQAVNETVYGGVGYSESNPKEGTLMWYKKQWQDIVDNREREELAQKASTVLGDTTNGASQFAGAYGEVGLTYNEKSMASAVYEAFVEATSDSVVGKWLEEHGDITMDLKSVTDTILSSPEAKKANGNLQAIAINAAQIGEIARNQKIAAEYFQGTRPYETSSYNNTDYGKEWGTQIGQMQITLDMSRFTSMVEAANTVEQLADALTYFALDSRQ